MSKSSSLSALLVGSLIATTCTVVSAANHSSSSTTESQIQAAVHAVEEGFVREDDPVTLSHRLYADDVVLLGEDDAHAAHGMAAAIEEVKGWEKSLGPDGLRTCKYTLVKPGVASRTTFSSFMLIHCAPNPPVLPQGQDLRMMYVWRKLPQGWRVELEMWAVGKF
jgi:ketosteroid isomerase-like protein